MAKKKSKKQDWEIIDDVSTMGYRDDSPYRNRESIDIYSPNGLIDMSETGMPILANGRYLPPYSGMHQFNPGVVREERIMQDGGDIDPEMLYKNKYNTPLNKRQTKKFNKWVEQESIARKRDILMDLGAYDVQGFWKSKDYKNRDSDGHGSDRWKKPNHPAFSNQSVYSGVDGNYGGEWKPDGAYLPSKQTLDLYGEDYLRDQFLREPNRPEYLDMSRFESGQNKPTPLVYKTGGSIPIMQTGGRPPLKILDIQSAKPNLLVAQSINSNTQRSYWDSIYQGRTDKEGVTNITQKELNNLGEQPKSNSKIAYKRYYNIIDNNGNIVSSGHEVPIYETELNKTNLGDINPIPFEQGSYFTRERKPQEADRGKMEYFDKKTGRSIGLYANGGRIPKAQIGTLTPGSSIGINMPTDLQPLTGLDLAFSKQERIPIQGNEELYNTVINNPKRYNFRIVDSRFFNYLPKEETPIQIKSKKPDLLQSQSTTPRKLEFTRERQPGERFSALYTPQGQKYSAIDVKDKSGKLIRTIDPITGKIAFKHPVTGEEQFEYGGELPEAGSGYKVVRSSERKGKTHKVTGPDGTVKFFGDSKLGQHPKDPARKKAFYARHKKNLDGNPYFRAFARKTWEYGGELTENDIPMAGNGKTILSYLNPKNWGVTDYTNTGNFDSAFSTARKAGEKEFLYNGQRFNTRKDTDPIKYTGANPNQEEYDEVLRTQYPEFFKLLNRGQNVGNISFEGGKSSNDEFNRAFIKKNPSLLFSGNSKIAVGQNPYSSQEFIGNLIAEAGHLKDNNLDESIFNPYTWKAAFDNFKFGETKYSIPGTAEYNAHRLIEPGVAMVAYGNLSPNDIKRIQKNLGVKEDGYFGEKTYKALQDKYKDDEYIKEGISEHQYYTSDKDINPISMGDLPELSKRYLNKLNKEVPLKYYDRFKNHLIDASYTDNALLSTSGDNMNALLLQQALKKRGYDLPKSTIKHGKLDGIYGDETKKALLDYQAKNKPYTQKAPLPGQSVPTMDFAQGGMLPDLAAMAFGGNLILEKYQEGGQKDIYKRPILSKIEEDPNINRSYYDPKLDIIYAGADYAKMTPEQKNKLLAHENYHAYQFKNDKATYLPVKDIPFAKPSMVSTPEIWNSYYNRKPIEVETDIYDFKSVNPSFQFVPEHLIFDKVVDPGQYENPYTMEGEADFYENTGKDFMKNGGSVWEILPQAQGGTKTGYSWSTQQAPSYQPTFQGNYASSQTTGSRALTSKEMQANKIAAEKRVQQQKQAEYEARQAEYAARQARIKESIAAQNQPLSAENIMTQSQSTGDKMSFAMNTPFGNPKDYPVLSGYMEGLDYINPFKFVGDMASGLGAVPYNVQQGNYGQAALSVAAPLTVGALAGIGTQGTKQFLNNVFNPVAGINFRKGALKKSPEISFEDYKNLNYEDRIKLINTVDETIQKKGNDIISDLKSAEGKKRLINQFKEADPNLSTEELEKLYDSRITSVERSIKGNRARWVKDLKNVKSLSDPPGSLKEAEEYIMSLDMDNYFPYDNAHYSSSSLYNYTDTPTSNTVKNNKSGINIKKTNRFLDPDPSPGYITLGKGYETSAPTVSHEVGHAIQKGNKMPIDDELRGLIDSAKHKKGNQFKGAIDDIWRRYFSGNKNFEGLDSNLEYFLKGSHGKEPYPFAREIRDLMLENKILNKTYDPITVQNLNKIKSQSKGIGKNDRLLYFIPPWDRAKLATTMNKAPGLLPYVGAGYLGYQGSQGVEEMPIQQFGGKISNWEIVPDSEWEMVDNINQFQKGGKVVSEIWQDVTGTPWSEAKKLGLTKGGYEENLAIRAELLKNPEKFISLVKEYSGKTKTQPAVKQPVQQPITNKYNSFAARSFSQPYFEGDTYQEAAPSPNVQQPLPTYQWSNQQRVSPNLATGDTPVATPRKAAPPKTQRVAITQRLPDLPLITNPINSPYFQAPIESTKVVPQMIKKGKQDSSIIQNIVNTINKSEFLKDVKDTIRNVKDVEDVKNSLIRGLGKTGLYAPDTEEVEPMKVPTQKPIIQPIPKPTMNSSAVQDTTPTTYYQGKGIVDPRTGTNIGRYVNTFSNWKGQEYIPTKNVGEWKKDKTTQYPSSQIAHYLLDVDLTTGYQHRYSKNYIESQKKGESITKGSTLKEQWLPVYEKLPNGNVRMKYKTNKELTKDDKIAAPLRQYKFGDLDWNSDIKSSWNKSSSALTTKTGEETLIIKSGKDMSGYGQFGGGSFVLISKRKNGEVIVRELAGSAQDLKIQAEDLAKMTGQNVNEIVVGYHDVGSWSAKPSSKNKKMGYSNIPKKSKNEFHSYQEDYTGAGLAFPFAYGGLTKSNWEIIK